MILPGVGGELETERGTRQNHSAQYSGQVPTVDDVSAGGGGAGVKTLCLLIHALHEEAGTGREKQVCVPATHFHQSYTPIPIVFLRWQVEAGKLKSTQALGGFNCPPPAHTLASVE